MIKQQNVMELGGMIRDKKGRPANDNKSITFADLTGVAVQDVVISSMALDALNAMHLN